MGFVAAAALVVSKMSLGLDAAPALFEGLGLFGFLLWLAFVAGPSFWLIRQLGEISEPAVGETVPVSP